MFDMNRTFMTGWEWHGMAAIGGLQISSSATGIHWFVQTPQIDFCSCRWFSQWSQCLLDHVQLWVPGLLGTHRNRWDERCPRYNGPWACFEQAIGWGHSLGQSGMLYVGRKQWQPMPLSQIYPELSRYVLQRCWITTWFQWISDMCPVYCTLFATFSWETLRFGIRLSVEIDELLSKFGSRPKFSPMSPMARFQWWLGYAERSWYRANLQDRLLRSFKNPNVKDFLGSNIKS